MAKKKHNQNKHSSSKKSSNKKGDPFQSKLEFRVRDSYRERTKTIRHDVSLLRTSGKGWTTIPSDKSGESRQLLRPWRK